MDKEEKKRREIESRIVELSEAVDVLDPNWLTSKELNAFVHSWYDLKAFYVESTSYDISLEAVREYVVFMRLLRRIMCDTAEDPSTRELAEETLTSLETAMELVIQEAVSNAHYDDQ
jgi:hypothetical protein